MDLDVVDHGITDRVGDLRCTDVGDLRRHVLGIGVRIHIGHIVDHSRNTLGNGLCRDDNDLLILSQAGCLVGRHNDVLIIRKDINGIRVDLINGLQDIIRTGVHGLAAGDDKIYAQAPEDLRNAFADSNGDKADILMGHLFRYRIFHRLRFRRLSGCHFFGSHFCVRRLFLFFRVPFAVHHDVLDLHTGNITIREGFLQDHTGIIGLHADFDPVAAQCAYDTVAYGVDEFHERILDLGSVLSGKMDGELFLINISRDFLFRLFLRGRLFLAEQSRVIDLLAHIGVIGAAQDT